MISAKEAREKAENTISSATQEQLSVAEWCIEKAIENGETRCYCGKFLGNRAVKKLNELGYTVENCSTQREGTEFLISW